MKVLVAGGAGFIGSHACERFLDRGDEVHALDNLSLGRKENIAHLLREPDFRFIQADLLEIDKLRALFQAERYHLVVHLAANSDIRRSTVEPELDLRQTFLTTYGLLECMRLTGTREILFASSSTVYGANKELLSEDTGPLLPVSMYGAAKLASESYLSAYAALHGISAWILRLPNVVGRRMTHGVIFDFIEKLRDNPTRLSVLGDGKQAKPYVLVEEVLDAAMLAYRASRNPINCFNIGVESATAVRTIAEIVIEEMGLRDVAVEYAGGASGWSGDVPRFQYNLSRIQAFGWLAQHTSDEAVRVAARAQLDFIKSRATSREVQA